MKYPNPPRDRGIAKDKPIIAQDKLAILQEKPIIVQNKPTVVGDKVAIIQSKPAIAKDKPVVTKGKPTIPTVKIVANVDIGAGNKLHIRGSGAGLSWEKGLPMKRTKNTWTWQGKSGESFEYKLLINDETWNVGENYSADTSHENTVTPTFE